MRIANNVMALNTHRFYSSNNNAISKSAEKLSSGYRINRAGDDAAGLAISEKMRAQVRGLNMAAKNSQDAVSLVQTAEGALQEVHSMLQRMNELAVQSASGTNDSGVDRAALQQEFANLQDEIDQVASTTTFNDMALLNGDLNGNADAVKVEFAITMNGETAATTFSAIVSGGQSGAAVNFVAGETVVTTSASKTDGIASSVDGLSSVYVSISGNDAEDLTITVSFAANADANDVLITQDLLNAALSEAVTALATSNTTLAGFAKEISISLVGDIEIAEGTTSTAVAAATGANTFGAAKGTSLTTQVGAEEYQELNVDVAAMNTKGLFVEKSDVDISTQETAQNAISSTRVAINMVSTQRAELGAMQNRLEHKISNLENTAENLTAAESRIRDTDIAAEMTTFTKFNILSQASTAMLAQANAAPQGVLSLLQ